MLFVINASPTVWLNDFPFPSPVSQASEVKSAPCRHELIKTASEWHALSTRENDVDYKTVENANKQKQSRHECCLKEYESHNVKKGLYEGHERGCLQH